MKRKVVAGAGIFSILASALILCSTINVNANAETTTGNTEVKGKWKTITGFFNINNNYQEVDYKISDNTYSNIIAGINYESVLTEGYSEKELLRNLSGLSIEKSYLITNNILSRNHVLTFNEGIGMSSALDDVKDTDNITKTEFLTLLYKSYYGVIESRPLIFNVGSVRYIDNGLMKVDYVKKYPVNGTAENVVFSEGDYYVYVNPSVYELYLTSLLEKGLLPQGNSDYGTLLQLENNSDFYSEYQKLEKSGIRPDWYPDSGNALVRGSTPFLGKSYSLNATGNIFSCEQPDYFEEEKLTVIDAFRIMELIMRASEKEMTELEANIITYKYGVQYLNSLTDADKNTVSFLIAKGVLNFEDLKDQALYQDLYSDISYETAYRLIYRIDNKSARFDFSEVQLTDSEAFWQSKGFGASDIQIYDTQTTEIPEMIILSQDEEKQNDTLSADDYQDLDAAEKAQTGEQPLAKLQRNITAMLSFVTPLNVKAKSSTANYVIEMLLENDYEYTYGGVILAEGTSGKDIPDLDSSVKIRTYNDTDMMYCKFKIEASNRNQAMSIVNSKLSVTNVAGTSASSLSGVTTLKTSGGESISMIAMSAITANLPDIKVVNETTLMNVSTRATALLLPEQGYAFVGNKIIESEEIVVTDATGEVYYNIKVICPILSNTSLKNINGKIALVCSDIKDEAAYTVANTEGTELEKNYVVNFSGLDDELYFNYDSMSFGISSITKNVTKKLNAKTTTSAKAKKTNANITIIVEWDYVVPNGSSGAEVLADTDSITIEQVNSFLTTAPTDEDLLYWWNMNVGMSNALANFMYGTTDVTYISCGYLVPSVTVLTSAGGRKSNKNTVNTVYEKLSLTDKQIRGLFTGMNLSDQYVKTYLGGDRANWFQKYYNSNTHKKSDIASELINSASFKCMARSSLKSSLISDGIVYGSDKDFVVVKNGTVYQRIAARSGLVVSDGRLIIETKTNATTSQPAANSTVISVASGAAQVKFKYLGTVSSGSQTYYKMLAYANDDGSPAEYKLHYKGKDNKTDLVNVNKYSYNGTSLLDYEKYLYDLFDIKNPYATQPYSMRFGINETQGQFTVGNVYTNFYLSGRSVRVLFKQYKRNDNTGTYYFNRITSDSVVKKAESLDIYANVTVYLPTSKFYFTQDGEDYQLKKGNIVGALNTKIYYTGLNNIIRDTVLAQRNDVVRVNDLKTGTTVFIGDYKFEITKQGTLQSDIFLNPLTSYIAAMQYMASGSVENDSVKSTLLKLFTGAVIRCGGVDWPLASYINNITIGDYGEINPSVTSSLGLGTDNFYLYTDNGKLFYKNKSGKATEIKGNSEIPANLAGMTLKMTVSDNLLCRPLDINGTVYTLLTVSEVYASTGMENLPFYAEYLFTRETSNIETSWDTTKYDVTQFVRNVKAAFLEEFQAALKGNLKSLINVVILTIVAYLLISTFLSFLVLKFHAGKTIFALIAMQDYRTGKAKGVDLIKILTLGIYDINDEPQLAKFLVLQFTLIGIITIMVNWFG